MQFENKLNPYDLVGIPYALPSDPPHTFDCFSLVEYVRRLSFAKETPIPFQVEGMNYPDIARAIVKVTHLSLYRYVEEFIPGDVVQLEECHIGVALPEGVLQAWRANGRGSVVVTSWPAVGRLFSMCRFLREATS